MSYVSELADIETSSRGNVFKYGNDCVIDSFVKIKFAGGNGDISIGDSVYINSGCVIYSGNGMEIGSDVLIAANYVLAATDHRFTDSTLPIRNQGFSNKGGIKVQNNVWIGANSTILDGSVIGEGAVISAGSVVRGHVEPYCLYGGVPAVKIRNLKEIKK